MKKTTLFLMFALATFSFTHAQYLKIIKPGGTHIVNDSVLVCTGNTTDEMVASLYVINADTGTVTLKARRNYISVIGNTHNAVCWAGYCYDTSVGISTLSQTIAPGDTANSSNNPFSGDYYPNSHSGASTIRYTFYDTKRTWDTASVVIMYESFPAGIAQLSNGQINFSTPYPNPSQNSVTFNYNLTGTVQSANLKIFNLLGECVQILPLNISKNKTTLDVQSLPSGVYVCQIMASGCQSAYQKMIVAH